jgi:hypothetical protein
LQIQVRGTKRAGICAVDWQDCGKKVPQSGHATSYRPIAPPTKSAGSERASPLRMIAACSDQSRDPAAALGFIGKPAPHILVNAAPQNRTVEKQSSPHGEPVPHRWRTTTSPVEN